MRIGVVFLVHPEGELERIDRSIENGKSGISVAAVVGIHVEAVHAGMGIVGYGIRIGAVGIGSAREPTSRCTRRGEGFNIIEEWD